MATEVIKVILEYTAMVLVMIAIMYGMLLFMHHLDPPKKGLFSEPGLEEPFIGP